MYLMFSLTLYTTSLIINARVLAHISPPQLPCSRTLLHPYLEHPLLMSQPLSLLVALPCGIDCLPLYVVRYGPPTLPLQLLAPLLLKLLDVGSALLLLAYPMALRLLSILLHQLPLLLEGLPLVHDGLALYKKSSLSLMQPPLMWSMMKPLPSMTPLTLTLPSLARNHHNGTRPCNLNSLP